MDISVIISSFSLLFLAEMGDKTQLMAMTLAHRYSFWSVTTGAFSAFAVLNLLAVWVGEALFRYVPQDLVLVVAGLLFLGFAYLSWRNAGDGDGEEEGRDTDAPGAFVSSFILIFVAELGDKTQLAMVALVAATGEIWSVFVGGTLALWTVALIGILLGRTVLRRIPRAWMHRAAAVMFLVFGLAAVGRVLLGESSPA